MANIFRLMKLARTAYKAAPVVVPIALAVAKYAKGKLEERAGSTVTQRDTSSSTPGTAPRTPPKA